jgi:hypothetical protein
MHQFVGERGQADGLEVVAESSVSDLNFPGWPGASSVSVNVRRMDPFDRRWHFRATEEAVPHELDGPLLPRLRREVTFGAPDEQQGESNPHTHHNTLTHRFIPVNRGGSKWAA